MISNESCPMYPSKSPPTFVSSSTMLGTATGSSSELLAVV